MHHLIRQRSDHALLHMVCNISKDQVVRTFRFLNFWTKHEDFTEVVENIWNKEAMIGTSITIVHNKVKRLKVELAKWRRRTFSNIF